MIYGKYVNQIEYDGEDKIFILSIKVDSEKGFMEEMHCNRCFKKIEEEKPYFCVTEEIFFHKKCLMKASNHPKRFDASGEHEDYPVIIKFIIEQKKEVQA